MNYKVILIFFLFSFYFAIGTRNDFLYDFLNLGANAKVQALGNTGIVTALDAEAVFYNPANMFFKGHKNVVFSLNPLYFDMTHLYLFFTKDSSDDPLTKYGVGYIELSMEGIEERGSSNTYYPSKIISATDQALIASMSRMFPPSTSVGMNYVYVISNYSQQQKPLFFSVGINHLDSSLKLKLNSTLQMYDNYGYKFSLGAMSFLHPQIRPTFVGEMYYNETFTMFYVLAGLEYIFSPELKFYLGYQKGQVSFGVGTELIDKTTLNYAFILTDLGMRHQFSFSMNLLE
jgi:hypothetical protein